jgi:hypothetical protein
MTGKVNNGWIGVQCIVTNRPTPYCTSIQTCVLLSIATPDLGPMFESGGQTQTNIRLFNLYHIPTQRSAKTLWLAIHTHKTFFNQLNPCAVEESIWPVFTASESGDTPGRSIHFYLRTHGSHPFLSGTAMASLPHIPYPIL